MRVLVFCRTYLVADFKKSVAPLADQFDFQFLTDGACKGVADTRAAFYTALHSDVSFPDMDSGTESDVIARCRLLRNLDPAQARRLLHAMATTLDAKLREIKPQVVFCHWVDEYSLHLLSILTRRRGIRFIAYAASYFPGLVQLTDHSNGRALNVRNPDPAEVERTIEAITPRDFRQDYRQPTRHSLFRQAWGVARYAAKTLIFKAKSIWERDPWGMHYKITPYVVDRRRLRDFPAARLFESDWQGTLHAMQKMRPNSRTLFMPLSYFPEASTDYWVSDKSILDYENMIVRMIEVLGEHYHLIVKEHPHMVGGRSPSFYSRLRGLPSVVNVDPYAFSADVLLACDGVILGGGSVGIEAYLRDKPIFSYCDNSYWYAPSGATFLSLTQLTRWRQIITERLSSFHLPTNEEKRAFVLNCLRTTAPAREGGRRWPLMAANELGLILREQPPVLG